MGSLIPVKITSSIGTIQDNLDIVEASIREKVEEYKKTVVTEDTIKDNKHFKRSEEHTSELQSH